MKKRYSILMLAVMLTVAGKTVAQNIAINATGNLPDTSAMLDVSSTVKGFLAPRMTTAQQNSIPLPATGLMVFNTTLGGFTVNTGTAAAPSWTTISSTAQTFATGTTGNDFNISTSGSVNTFNIPDAGAAARGLVTTGSQTIAGAKTLTGPTTISGTLTAGNTVTLSSTASGAATDSILTVNAAGVVRKRTVTDVVNTVNYPVTVIVAASRTNNYTPGSSFTPLAYNSASINAGSAYNTSTGIFTAPATGLYQISISNMYSVANSLNNTVSARIIVNGSTETEVAGSLTPYAGSTIRGTINGNTVVQMSSGQTASISIGNLANTMTPSVGTGQHTLKIIRLN
ncbi:MAG: hypothetical protein IPP72_20430 [Chitinophagaceae bacterium]|nr:hypothetical protein [Chitinophagaceae bacterium]